MKPEFSALKEKYLAYYLLLVYLLPNKKTKLTSSKCAEPNRLVGYNTPTIFLQRGKSPASNDSPDIWH